METTVRTAVALLVSDALRRMSHVDVKINATSHVCPSHMTPGSVQMRTTLIQVSN